MSSDGVTPRTPPGGLRPPEPPRIEHFIDRKDELHALSAAYRDLLEERLVCVYVRGKAGIGKTALLHHFLMGLRHEQGALVLRARCVEGDATPFNGFASLSGALTRYLKRLPPAEARALLPRDAPALGRLLPSLGAALGAKDGPEGGERGEGAEAAESQSAQEIRQRGFAALRQLLWRIAERRPLVLSLEDLQWIDRDSVALLLDLVRPPEPPAMLFIGSYRSDDVGEAQASAPLAELLEQHRARGKGGEADLREIEVGPLGPADAEELVLSLLYAWDPESRARAAEIARASGGNPRLIGELTRAMQAAPAPGSGSGAGLDDALRARLARLPDQARRLLEVVAVAGAPIDPAAAVLAARLAPDEQAAALALLCTEDLARARRSDGRDTVEIFHDELREVIAARLDAERRRAHHRALAKALTASGSADAELVATHWIGAGEPERALRYLVLAADQASDALAFERAARLYRRALDLDPGEGPALSVKCGDALANAGESAEAAAVFAAAAALCAPAAAQDLRRRAAEHYLRSGHIDEGLALLRAVLRGVGLSFPGSPRRSLLGLAVRRAELRLRGLRFRERPEAEQSPEALARIDACWSVTVGLTAVDLIRAADFSARGLLLALKAGEPHRVARAIAFEAASACMVGGRSRARAEALVRELRALAARLESPHAHGLSALASGVLECFSSGNWREAADWYERAEEIFRDRCVGVAWELATTQLLMSWARFYLGRIDALHRALPGVLRAAEQRGDRYAVAVLSAAAAWAALAADDVTGARRAIAAAMSGWSQADFHLEHLIELCAHGFVERYAGRPAAAWRRFQERWGALEGSLLLRLQNHRITARVERAATALAAAEDAADPEPLVQVALRDAAALEREETAWCAPFTALIRGGAAALRGDRAAALDRLDEATAGFEARDLALYAAAARRQAGALHGGEKGLQQKLIADAVMARENLKNPARWAAMLAPGFSKLGARQ